MGSLHLKIEKANNRRYLREFNEYEIFKGQIYLIAACLIL